jgi:hypothetical protein
MGKVCYVWSDRDSVVLESYTDGEFDEMLISKKLQ